MNRADLHFAIEGSKSHIEILAKKVPTGAIEQGRGMKVRKEKAEARVINWVFNNFVEDSMVYAQWRSRPVEVRLMKSRQKDYMKRTG